MARQAKARSQLIRTLSTSDLTTIIDDWVEAYETGWRPLIRITKRHDELYEKLRELKREIAKSEGGYSYDDD